MGPARRRGNEPGHQEAPRRLPRDAAAGEFVVHSPDEGARKDYIGNAARDGRLAVVFAQLITDGTPRGVHAFLVHPRPGR
ncbi:MAG TPA: hypothetical protein VFQ15_01250 [Jiangellaceae bacterium]|nr:hypothetical protein [Jiangellaceae bacterium]